MCGCKGLTEQFDSTCRKSVKLGDRIMEGVRKILVRLNPKGADFSSIYRELVLSRIRII